MDLEGEDNSPHSASSLSLGCPTIHRNELELLCSIGEGGFCEVWEGRWFGAPVAVKKLKVTDDAKADADAALDFLAEIQLHSHLAFPLLVPVLGCCVAPDPRDVWLVMEQAPLGSLFGILHVHDHRTKPLDMPLALRTCLAADCASAVAYVHARGIVHRDIKSMNVLVFQGWRLKLCDFGLAVPVASCGAPFPKQRGTYAWMAPESMTDKIYGFASDVFALAVLVFELAKRRLPFDGASNDAISAAVAGRGERPSLAEVAGVDEHVPLAVQDVLEAGWAQDPLARPHASEMEDALRRIGDERFGGDPRNDALLLELNIDLSAQLPDELGDDGLGGRGHGARDGGEDGGNGLDSGGGGGGGEADAPGPRAKESGELPVDAGGARGGSSAGARGSVADNAADGDGEPGSGGEPESARVGLLRQALTSPTAADIEARGGGRGGGGAPPVSAVGGGAGGAGADRGSSQQFFSPLGGGDHWACYREGLADTPRQNATAATTPAAAAGGAGAGGHSPEASARGGAQPHADRQPRDASARGPAAAAAANSTPAAATLAPVRTGGGSGSGGGVLASPVRRWDDGLDVAMLKVAFQEMAESGVIFERSKELSLHLSRSQAKPFVHNSETGQSVFLDEVKGTVKTVWALTGVLGVARLGECRAPCATPIERDHGPNQRPFYLLFPCSYLPPSYSCPPLPPAPGGRGAGHHRRGQRHHAQAHPPLQPPQAAPAPFQPRRPCAAPSGAGSRLGRRRHGFGGPAVVVVVVVVVVFEEGRPAAVRYCERRDPGQRLLARGGPRQPAATARQCFFFGARHAEQREQQQQRRVEGERTAQGVVARREGGRRPREEKRRWAPGRLRP